eukprot:CAMPEP_0183581236 /NCGR_PEP_ID=MMETSP0371-20130417/147276_1 /TAXON_ID=268820 /ORGANISM="Peridinium aciculiferum, Strain PAER-2" /LENGTH=67 /DNA_ID=CAMNT_0025791899 /DNA_START=57 /DNA_END=256 /DNA_ORIENTATION=+
MGCSASKVGEPCKALPEVPTAIRSAKSYPMLLTSNREEKVGFDKSDRQAASPEGAASPVPSKRKAAS